MIRTLGTLSPVVRALLDEERSIPVLPSALRARAVARARAALAAGAVPPPASSARGVVPFRWAASVSLACAASAAALIVAYDVHMYVTHIDAPIAGSPAPAQIVAPPTAPDAVAVFDSRSEELPRARPRVLPPPR